MRREGPTAESASTSRPLLLIVLLIRSGFACSLRLLRRLRGCSFLGGRCLRDSDTSSFDSSWHSSSSGGGMLPSSSTPSSSASDKTQRRQRAECARGPEPSAAGRILAHSMSLLHPTCSRPHANGDQRVSDQRPKQYLKQSDLVARRVCSYSLRLLRLRLRLA